MSDQSESLYKFVQLTYTKQGQHNLFTEVTFALRGILINNKTWQIMNMTLNKGFNFSFMYLGYDD